MRYLELGAFLLLCLDFLPQDLLLLVALISVCAPACDKPTALVWVVRPRGQQAGAHVLFPKEALHFLSVPRLLLEHQLVAELAYASLAPEEDASGHPRDVLGEGLYGDRIQVVPAKYVVVVELLGFLFFFFYVRGRLHDVLVIAVALGLRAFALDLALGAGAGAALGLADIATLVTCRIAVMARSETYQNGVGPIDKERGRAQKKEREGGTTLSA